MSLRRFLTDFSNDSRGSVAIIFGLSAFVLLIVAGLAIDTARFQDVASRMQAALDASTLAGAKLLADDTATVADIQAMTQANFSASIQKIGVKLTSITPLNILVDRPTDTVEAKVQATVPMFFGKIANVGSWTTISQSSKVVYSMLTVELSMVLDITGSMNNNNKLADMKVAAKDVIDTLYASALSDNSVKIAVAPFSASVNAGDLASAVSNAPVTTVCPTKPKKGEACQDNTGSQIDTCVIERINATAATDAAPVGADALPTVPTTPYGNYKCPASTVIPLTGRSDAATIKSTIDGYTAGGSTAGHIGTAWGWYLISPEWASVLPASSQPQPYGSGSVMKTVLIMTDGLFNTSYKSGGSTASATQTDESYAQFQALCDGMKSKEINVFTVGLNLSAVAASDPRAKTELQNCASGAANFFDAETGADLKKAFQKIAQRLTTMRVAN